MTHNGEELIQEGRTLWGEQARLPRCRRHLARTAVADNRCHDDVTTLTRWRLSYVPWEQLVAHVSENVAKRCLFPLQLSKRSSRLFAVEALLLSKNDRRDFSFFFFFFYCCLSAWSLWHPVQLSLFRKAARRETTKMKDKHNQFNFKRFGWLTMPQNNKSPHTHTHTQKKKNAMPGSKATEKKGGEENGEKKRRRKKQTKKHRHKPLHRAVWSCRLFACTLVLSLWSCPLLYLWRQASAVSSLCMWILCTLLNGWPFGFFAHCFTADYRGFCVHCFMANHCGFCAHCFMANHYGFCAHCFVANHYGFYTHCFMADHRGFCVHCFTADHRGFCAHCFMDDHRGFCAHCFMTDHPGFCVHCFMTDHRGSSWVRYQTDLHSKDPEKPFRSRTYTETLSFIGYAPCLYAKASVYLSQQRN